MSTESDWPSIMEFYDSLVELDLCYSGTSIPQSLLRLGSPYGGGTDISDSDSIDDISPQCSGRALHPLLPLLELPGVHETERYLRRMITFIPSNMPLCLESLPDDAPPLASATVTIVGLVILAIWGSPTKRLSASEIYSSIQRRWPVLRHMEREIGKASWKGSIRHALTLKAIFVKIDDGRRIGKGHPWGIDIRKGDGNTRDRKRRPSSGRSTQPHNTDTTVEYGQPRRQYQPHLVVHPSHSVYLAGGPPNSSGNVYTSVPHEYYIPQGVQQADRHPGQFSRWGYGSGGQHSDMHY